MTFEGPARWARHGAAHHADASGRARRSHRPTARRATTRASPTTTTATTSSRPRTSAIEHHDHRDHTPHESPLVMLIPLGVLAFGALFAGLVFKGYFIGHGTRRVLEGLALHTARQPHPAGDAPRPGLGGLLAVHHDAARLPARLLHVYPPARAARPSSPRSSRSCTASCSTSGTSTSSTTRSSCVRPSGSAASCGRRATARVIDGIGPGRHLGPRRRRHPRRRAAADRLRLPLRLRDADRRRGARSPGTWSSAGGAH